MMRPMNRYDDGPGVFGYLLRLLMVLILLGGLGFLGFAGFGDLGRTPEPRSLPVSLDQG